MSLSFLRRFVAGAMIGAAGSFAAACGTLGESLRYAPAPVPPLGSGPEPARSGERPPAKRPGTPGR
jgi:hypothetical protein